MLQIKITNERQQTEFVHPTGTLEFGRSPKPGGRRFVVDDRFVSRDQLRIDQLPNSQVRLENLGATVRLPGGTKLERGETEVLDLPVFLTIGQTKVEISNAGSTLLGSDGMLQTIQRPHHEITPRAEEASLASLGASPSSATLTAWFETLLAVQRAAAGSAEFYEETSRAVVDLVGLDRGLVLLRAEDGWQTAASFARNEGLKTNISRSVLSRMAAEKRTFFRTPKGAEREGSLTLVEAVVAAPILGVHDKVVGAVYGSRDVQSPTRRFGIHPLEAQFVQLLAGSVSAGLARMEREAEATRLRIQFERFFSPVLARELERNPDLLEARDREITVMFADMRGFSKISERLGPRETYQLMGDVLDRLTNKVLENDGVVVDYYGDGFLAIWNAPIDQSEHAALACRAAIEMQRELPALNRQWQDIAAWPLRVGIGLSTGIAQVGNAGSRRRLKYGPRGHVVNVASRAEGATKYLGVPVLLTGESRRKLCDSFAIRRLCRARVVGIDGEVQLHELYTGADDDWPRRMESYEEALRLFEAGQFEASKGLLDRLLEDPVTKEDCPTLLLSRRVHSALREPAARFNPVYELESK